jgi:gliding motility-associated-like protein
MYNKIMNNVIKTVALICLVLCFTPEQIKATHIVGGNITYKYLGNERFEVTLSVRRDCFLGSEEAEFDDPASIGVYDANGNLLSNLPGIGLSILIEFNADDTLNNIVISDCGFEGEQVCVHETVYRRTVRLPRRPGGYFLAYNRCCRNASLQNIVDPLETGASFFTRIEERVYDEGNSSPVFKQWPSIYICANESLVFDGSATDDDGDSLVYSLVTPYTGGTIDRPKPQPQVSIDFTRVEWQVPFGLNNLMGGVPLRVDPQTGEFTALPAITGQFLVGVSVKEYRNGVLLGETIRDFQYNVRVCSDPPMADFSNPDLTCNGTTVAFENQSTNANQYQWNFNFPTTDSAFISTEENPVFTFPSTGTYDIRLIATRGSDACADTSITTIGVFETNLIADFDLELSECSEAGEFTVTVTDQSEEPDPTLTIASHLYTFTQGSTVITSSDPNTSFDVREDTSFTISLLVTSSSGCTREAIIETSVDDLLPQIGSTYAITGCLDSLGETFEITFQDTSFSTGNIIDITWNIDNGTQDITLNGPNPNTLLNFQSDSLIIVEHIVTLDNGCENSEVFTIDPTKEVVSLVFLDEPISICTGDSTRIIANPNSNWTYTWESTDGLFFPDPTDLSNPIFVGDTTTSYTVTVADSLCSYTDSITIELIDQVDLSIEGIAIDCDGGIQLTGIGGGNPNLYQWSLDSSFSMILFTGNPFLATVSDNDAVFYVRYTNGICSSPFDSIPASDVLAIADYTFEQIDCPDRDSVNIRFTDDSNNGSPGFIPTSWTWMVGPLTSMLNTFTDETFIVTLPKDEPIIVSITVTYENGCESTTRDTITPGPYANISFVGDPVISICTGDSTRVVANPDSNLTYIWEPETDLVFGSDKSDPLFVGDSAATYYVTVTDGICEVEDSITIEFADQIDLEIEGETIGCDGEIRLTGIGGGNPDFYEWAITDDFNDIVFTGNPYETSVTDITTVYYVRYNNGECTSEIDSIAAADVLARAMYTYEAMECPTPDSVTLIFTDTSTSPSEGFTVVDRIWILGQIGSTITDTNSQVTLTLPKDSLIVINLSVTYENGCESMVADTIVPGPFATINFDAAVIQACEGDSIRINNSPNSNFTYIWEPETDLIFEDPNDKSNPLFVGNQTTTYNVTVSDGLCEIDTTVTIEIVDLIDLEIIGDIGVCDDDVKIYVQGALGDGDYEWSTNSNFIPVLSVGDTLITTLIGNQTTYYVRYTSENCNSPTDSITLENKNIDIDYFEPFPICPGDQTMINFFNLDPEQILTFMWQDDPHIIDGQDTGTPTISVGVDETEDFDLVYTVFNQFGCEETDTVSFTIETRPEIGFEYFTDSCGGFTICFIIPDSFDFNGFPNWDFGDTTTTDDISIDAAPCYTYPGYGDYLVSLSSIAASCASDTFTQLITVYPQVDIIGATDTIVCEGDVGTVRPSSNITGTMFMYCDLAGDTLGSGPQLDVTVLTDTTIVIKGIAPDDCTDQDTVTLRLYEFDPVVEIPELVCVNQETIISISSASGNDYSYQWGPEDCIVEGGDTSTPTIQVADAKSLFVTITDNTTGCSDVFEYFVDVTEFTIDVEADPDAEINLGESVDILVVDQMEGETYMWNNGSMEGTQTVMPEETTTYVITVTDEDGCEAVDSITIRVIQPTCDEEDIYLPNAFSPNGDEINDVLFVRSNFIDEMTLVIYNRWGQEVFSSNDQSIGWDGTFDGDELAPDVYAYSLSVLCIDGDTYASKGNINLIR